MKPNVATTIILISFLTSCSSLGVNNIAPGYVEAFGVIKKAVFGVENEIDPNVISSIPYASMLVKIGKGPEALMILESIYDDKYTWVSADGVYLVTRNGRIIQTQGLPNNLMNIMHPEINWTDNEFEKVDFVSYYSFEKPLLNNLKVMSSFRVGDIHDKKLSLVNLRLQKIEESLYSKEVNWSELNEYWTDEKGYVWLSRQSISPKLPPIYYEVTKKPR
ncbi:YjbF family lipoprotein [Gammaproteobacteria bacterium]|nr:YjbF family lipoprotein [Gammaproteobacteria bacterium]